MARASPPVRARQLLASMSASPPPGREHSLLCLHRRRPCALATTSAWPPPWPCTAAVTGVLCDSIRPSWRAADQISGAAEWFLAKRACANSARGWRAPGRPTVWCGHWDPARCCQARRPRSARAWWPGNREVEPAGGSATAKWPPPCRPLAGKLLAAWGPDCGPPDTFSTGSAIPNRVYGPYWRRWRQQAGATRARRHTHPTRRPAACRHLDALRPRGAERASCRRAGHRRLRIWTNLGAPSPAPNLAPCRRLV